MNLQGWRMHAAVFMISVAMFIALSFLSLCVYVWLSIFSKGAI